MGVPLSKESVATNGDACCLNKLMWRYLKTLKLFRAAMEHTENHAWTFSLFAGSFLSLNVFINDKSVWRKICTCKARARAHTHIPENNFDFKFKHLLTAVR